MDDNLLEFQRNSFVVPQETEASSSIEFSIEHALECNFMCHAPSFSSVSLDAREVRLGTGLESRRSSIFYPLTPKS